MRKFLLLLLLAVVSAGRVAADEVTPASALQVAQRVLGSVTRGGDIVVAWDSNNLAVTRSGNDVPSFYVVAMESGRGFVVVAGDDALAPVLAYSFDYPAPDIHSMHPALEGWFRYVDSAVRYVRLNSIYADSSTATQWAYPAVAKESIMLNTARWSQGEPYNRYCPMDGDYRSLTGCAQTAMAVIMHYYRWPEVATGVTEPFTTMTKGIDVSSRDLNHAYDWDNMLMDYVEGAYSDTEANAVAQLMADLGHSFKADYGWDGTGALPDAVAMYENYGYSPLCHYLMRDNFSLESWNNMMRNEIERGRPVYYSGYTASEEGHAFVLDGVDANDYFHVNWGWGGASDGFFKLDALVLDDYVFDTSEWAYLGLYPMRDGVFDNWLYLYGEGLEFTTEEFVRGEPFTIDNITIANPSAVDFEGEMCVGHCDIDGNFKSWVTSAVPFSLISGYANTCNELSALIEGEICAGDRLRVFYRVSGSEAWSPMMPYLEGVCWEVVLKRPSIGDTTSFEFDRNRGVVELRFESDVVATLRLLNENITSGVECGEGVMIIDTSYLRHGTAYTIYLERSNGESKSIMFTLNETVL